MDLGIGERSALVCAASRGIGRACAEALAAEGARVAICGRDAEALRQAAAEISVRTGGLVLPVPADLSSRAETDALFDRVLAEFGRIDILVTNAGGPRASDFLGTEDEDWARAYELTFLSAVRCIRRCLPGMIAARHGRIILLASFAVKQPIDNLILSNAVRSAVTAMAKTLSREVAEHNVTVNTVLPGYVLTDRLRALIAKRAREGGIPLEDAMEAGVAEVPAGRFGSPDEVAAVVAFLASSRAPPTSPGPRSRWTAD